ncbi:MAG: xylulokinase [Planctomycetota bacterium]|nr:MAG: xylulokinase [Planctomycetota bacterium]
MALFLGVDVGTQGTKALVYDADGGRVLGRGAAAYGLLPATAPGAAEQDPRTWIAAMKAAAAQALQCPGVDRRAVRGIGVSGQQHGCVALDARGQVLRPAKLWCDTETAPEAAELSQRLGRPIPAGFTASKVLWLKRREPQHFARLRRVLLPHDYVNLHLTGAALAEAGDASGTGYFDPVRRDYDLEACAAIDGSFAQCLPPLIGPDQAAGSLRPEVARRLELPPGCIVAPGSGDNMLSALGAGAVAEGVLVLSLGTSGTLFGHSARPLLDPEGLIAPFCDATGGWLPLLCTMNCTTVAEEVRRAFGGGLEALTVEAEREPAGCEGVSFLPYLAGERAPNWPHASAALLGLRPGHLRRGLLFRAALEGATFALREGLERLRALGMPVAEIRLVGGGSRNRLWRQIVADVFGVPLRIPAEAESAALGGALQAAAVAGGAAVGAFVRSAAVPMEDAIVVPRAEATASYDAARAAFRAGGQALFDRLQR